MDGTLAGRAIGRFATPGACFGEVPAPGRVLDGGMGMAVARRTVFRADDAADFGRVADRVAHGNMALLGDAADPVERARLRNAIACGALITSGRHLQHGDATQPSRNMEVFTNCATAAAAFTLFYLLLNGSGVGRAYDDALMAVDWARAPDVRLRLDAGHPDVPATPEARHRFGLEFGLLPWGSTPADMTAAQDATVAAWIADAFEIDAAPVPGAARVLRIADSREGWAKAVELLESMAFAGAAHETLLLDFSAIRPCGAAIAGMQGRPASGPLSLMRAFDNLRRGVIGPARAGTIALWEQALLVNTSMLRLGWVASPCCKCRPARPQHGGVHQLRHRRRCVHSVLPAAERQRRRPRL